MKTLRFILAGAALGITLAACGAEGPTTPARTPGHRAADGSADSTQTTGQTPPSNDPVPNSSPPAPLPGEPPPPDDRGGQITGPGA